MTILYLAPLNKLGNAAFRELALECGADFVFSEMIRCEKLLLDDIVQLRKSTIVKELQSKTILQIICEDDLSNISKSVHKLKTLNLGILEINYNMGCPQSSLCKNENGGGILKNRQKIKDVCKLLSIACKDNNLVPSIKTRVGLSRDEITILDTLKIASKFGINKVYIHGRVLGESYSKKACYDEIALAKKTFPNMEIIGNGDICDLDSYERMKKTGVNGILIGRCALEYPDVFEKLKNGNFTKNTSGEKLSDKKDVILRFLELAKKHNLSDSHIKANLAYLSKGCISGSEIRGKINLITNLEELQKFFHSIK